MIDTETRTESITEAPSLNAADRCDRCGAQAYVRAVLNDSDLLFCGHHGKRFIPGLIGAGFAVQDESDRLLADATQNTAS